MGLHSTSKHTMGVGPPKRDPQRCGTTAYCAQPTASQAQAGHRAVPMSPVFLSFFLVSNSETLISDDLDYLYLWFGVIRFLGLLSFEAHMDNSIKRACSSFCCVYESTLCNNPFLSIFAGSVCWACYFSLLVSDYMWIALIFLWYCFAFAVFCELHPTSCLDLETASLPSVHPVFTAFAFRSSIFHQWIYFF